MLNSLIVAAVAAALPHAAQAYFQKPVDVSGYLNYTTVTGYFLQDEASTNATAFDYVRTSLCLQ